MTELDTMIRKAVLERVDRAPMPPSIESIDALDRTSLSVTSRTPRRGVLVGAGLVALVALLAGVLVTARLTRRPVAGVGRHDPGSRRQAGHAPGRPLAAGARTASPNGVPGYHFLTMELDRPVGLAADDVAYLPTGPLGPMYAQSIRIDYDPQPSPAGRQDGFAVLTVLPEEQAAVLAAASGNGPTHTDDDRLAPGDRGRALERDRRPDDRRPGGHVGAGRRRHHRDGLAERHRAAAAGRGRRR